MIPKSQLKFFASLKQKKIRTDTGLFLIESKKLIEEALEAKEEILHVIATNDFYENWKITIDEEFKNVASEKDLERISSFKSASDVIAVVKQFDKKEIDFKSNLILVLDNISDPGNFGTIIRTCDWFGVNDIICSENTVERYNSKVVQSSMGSLFRVNCTYCDLPVMLSKIRDTSNYKIICSSVHGVSVYDNLTNDKVLLVLGSESHGISKELNSIADKTVCVPRLGKAESLNVAVASAILLSECKRN